MKQNYSLTTHTGKTKNLTRGILILTKIVKRFSHFLLSYGEKKEDYTMQEK